MGTTKDDDQLNDPSFIFLQLYGSQFLGNFAAGFPILLPANEVSVNKICLEVVSFPDPSHCVRVSLVTLNDPGFC